MKITKRQLRAIICEIQSWERRPHKGWNDEEKEAARQREAELAREVTFEWDAGGLEMQMLIDGQKVTGFMYQKQVKQLIKQLEELLAGPMRTSP